MIKCRQGGNAEAEVRRERCEPTSLAPAAARKNRFRVAATPSPGGLVSLEDYSHFPAKFAPLHCLALPYLIIIIPLLNIF